MSEAARYLLVLYLAEHHETEALALAGAVSPAVAERLEATLPLGATTDGTPPAFLASDGA